MQAVCALLRGCGFRPQPLSQQRRLIDCLGCCMLLCPARAGRAFMLLPPHPPLLQHNLLQTCEMLGRQKRLSCSSAAEQMDFDSRTCSSSALIVYSCAAVVPPRTGFLSPASTQHCELADSLGDQRSQALQDCQDGVIYAQHMLTAAR